MLSDKHVVVLSLTSLFALATDKNKNPPVTSWVDPRTEYYAKQGDGATPPQNGEVKRNVTDHQDSYKKDAPYSEPGQMKMPDVYPPQPYSNATGPSYPQMSYPQPHADSKGP